MNKIKNVFLIFIIFLCTACDVKYSINFNNNEINESIELKNVYFKNTNNELLLNPVNLIFQGYPYNIAHNDNNYEIYQTWKTMEDFMTRSMLFTDLNYNNSITVDGSKVEIDLSVNENVEKYISLFENPETMSISLYIPYYVSKHNADKVQNNTYIWEFDDLEDAHLKINFDMSKSYKHKTFLASILVIGVLSVIIIGVVIYFVQKNKKANEL